jgi:hypothetical protein
MKKFFIQPKDGSRGSNAQAGFAMLFTVVIISIILALALGIADVTFKQTILSELARDSQLAFYQADSGVECGLYYDLSVGQFPRGSAIAVAPNQITCGSNTASFVSSQSYTDYFVYAEDVANQANPCFTITFDKASDPIKNSVSTRGYSSCQSNPKQVERALNVTY